MRNYTKFVRLLPVFLLTIFTVCSFIASKTFTNEVPNLVMACTSINTWISSALVYVCDKKVLNSLVIPAVENRKYYVRQSVLSPCRPPVSSSFRLSVCPSVRPSVRQFVLSSYRWSVGPSVRPIVRSSVHPSVCPPSVSHWSVSQSVSQSVSSQFVI